MPVRHSIAVLGLAASLAATPALAQDDYYYDEGPYAADYSSDGYVDEPAHYEEAPALPPMPAAMPAVPSGPRVGYNGEQRDAWLAECHDRMRPRDDGLGGAVIGGLIGGVAGNRIAGRGNRLPGTIIGAGVGAIAGAAIDRGEDGGAGDYCEDYLARYEASLGGGASYGYGYAGSGHGGHHGGQPYVSGGVMWVPMMISGGCRKRCGCGEKEVVVEEVIEEAPPARRVIHRPAPTKRVKIQRYSK